MRIAMLERGAVPAAAEVIRHAFATVAEQYGLTEENCPTNGAFLSDAVLFRDVDDGVILFGAFDGETLCGVVGLRRKGGALFHLEKLAVDPWSRRRGCGGALLRRAVEAVRQAGGGTVSIGVMYENRELVRWYERHGFVRTEIRKFAYLPFVVCFMECRCAPEAVQLLSSGD